jgi:NADPH:quinone reductase
MKAMKCIRVQSPGGAEAMEFVDLALPEPGPGEVRVRIEAVGVNFIDVYHRSGLYALPTPFVLGSEGAGVVEEVGPGVTGLRPGDRVASSRLPGAYATHTVLPEELLVPVPDAIPLTAAAAVLLQGMTAHYLVNDTFPLGAGHTALIHAAAGGVGGLLVQLAKAEGARVIATASTSKGEQVRAAGADLVIDYTRDEFLPRVLEATGGAGVDVVYDSVGQSTFDSSLASLRTGGMLVMYGQSSGPVPPFDILRLSKKNLFLTRPSLGPFVADRGGLLGRAAAVFALVESGALRVKVDRELPLSEAREAHRILEGRGTTGKLLLMP